MHLPLRKVEFDGNGGTHYVLIFSHSLIFPAKEKRDLSQRPLSSDYHSFFINLFKKIYPGFLSEVSGFRHTDSRAWTTRSHHPQRQWCHRRKDRLRKHFSDLPSWHPDPHGKPLPVESPSDYLDWNKTPSGYDFLHGAI